MHITCFTSFSSKFETKLLPENDIIIINVADFGAKGDGKTDSSPSFLKAWTTACTSPKPTVIIIPCKRYFLSPIVFQGPCNNSNLSFHFNGSVLIAPDYTKIPSFSQSYWLMFYGVKGVSLIGGYLDSQGSSLWSCKLSGQHNCPAGATSLTIYDSKDILIRNLISSNAKLYHIVVHTCKNVTLQSVGIYAPEKSPNTDGVHVQNSIDVCMLNTVIKTGDDCVSIGPGTRNLKILRVACGPGHGISIGSLGKELEEDGVENVTVKNVVFTGTQNGLRIKSWGRPSNGFVRGVVFKQVVMNEVQNPIVIDQNYCPDPLTSGCPNQNSGIKISNVTYADVKGTSASEVAMRFDCSASYPCKWIGLRDIKLTYQENQPAQSFCRNIRGIALGLVTPPSCL
ncbi:polygalacturonase-like [Telopea speciosissima]|uniref:polygalacturonase-like n=1 Tax=Telopea speciosissima TaxID=54955 RepID=UPI001CC520AA|nr:polygalacturonase-like [Telopea speciosissima]